ncbi:hypothetical protein [Devosia sp. 2618]|uniref:hypothetical protein n=1 Tax=Devosia sp. 2618 TaxID=3156454 RepID=UPI00339139C8
MTTATESKLITIDRHQLTMAIDELDAATIRCEAAHMAALALDGTHRDAVQFLAADAQNCIEVAKDRLEEMRNTHRLGGANG